MSPTRTQQVGNHLIEEYWWAGRFVVYVDHRAVDGTFEEVVERQSPESTKQEPTP